MDLKVVLWGEGMVKGGSKGVRDGSKSLHLQTGQGYLRLYINYNMLFFFNPQYFGMLPVGHTVRNIYE